MLDAANAKLRKPDLACETIADYDTKTLASVNSYILSASGSNTSGGSSSSGIVYYPVYGKDRCLSDGNEPSWLGRDAKFDNPEDCCAENFSWVEEKCLANSPAIAPPVVEEIVDEVIPEEINISALYYPSQNGYVCVNDGLQPSWMTVDEMFSKESDCCERHYPDRDCLGKSGQMKPKLWYPSTDGVMCVSDRKQPSWMSLDSMFQTEAECCAFHYAWKHDCSSDSQPSMYQNFEEGVTLTPEPTNHPTRLSTPNPAFKMEPIITPRPTRRPRKTDSPSRNPSTQPSRRPTRPPTRPPVSSTRQPQTVPPSRQPSTQPSRRPTRPPTRPPVSSTIPVNNMASPFETFQIQTPTSKPAMPPIGSSYLNFYFKPTSKGGDHLSQAIAMNAPTQPTLGSKPLNKGGESHIEATGGRIESQVKGSKKKHKKKKKKKKKKGWKKMKNKKKMKQFKWKNNR